MEKFDRRNTYQYKLKESKFDELKNLGSLLIGEHKDVFKRAYGSLLGVLMTKMDPRDQFPYIGVVEFPEVVVVAQALHLEKNLVEANLRTKGNVRGFTSKFLFEKDISFASSGSQDAFYDVFALIIYGIEIEETHVVDNIDEQEPEYKGPPLNFHITAPPVQPNPYAATMVPPFPNNPTLQYAYYGAPLTPNVQHGGQITQDGTSVASTLNLALMHKMFP
ncbi:hypothetical protein KIW84_073786 [Lathyrus oleraceus]|uniref:DUF7745 domain-containing protein n=1 Tax=Pisum sativum TaxID=3888 RepID=A0A9D4VQ45_PEA|nr:hypothetical protein KIW84_073786 [Pisum sativum]